MIIYNKTWLENLHVREQAKIWFRQNLISIQEKEKVELAYSVGFYSPSFWMSLGLFFFTTIAISSASGFIFLLVLSGNETNFYFVSFILSVICFFLAEHYKSNQHFFQAGADNALVWAGIGYLSAAVFGILSSGQMADVNLMTTGFFVSFLICTAATIRYADVLSCISSFLCWFVFLFFVCGQLGQTVKALLPFISMLNAATIYFFAKKWNKGKTKIYWGTCLLLVEAAAMLMVYISVNYFVVREMSAMMFDLQLAEGQDIPFAFMFYFFTFAIPAFYIFWSLKTKDRLMLRIALLLVVVSILTIRHYHAIMPAEVAMTVGGFLLLGISYVLIRYLKNPKRGFTYENEEENSRFLQIEGLVIAQTFGAKNNSNHDPNFGGGSFGGGGAAGNY